MVLDSITEGVFTVDRDWRVTSFNRAARQITGIARPEEPAAHAASAEWRMDVADCVRAVER